MQRSSGIVMRCWGEFKVVMELLSDEMRSARLFMVIHLARSMGESGVSVADSVPQIDLFVCFNMFLLFCERKGEVNHS